MGEEGDRHGIRSAAAPHPELARQQAGRVRAPRHGRVAVPGCRARGRRRVGCGRQRDRRRSGDRIGARRHGALEQRAGRHRLRTRAPGWPGPGGGARLRPARAGPIGPIALQADGKSRSRPVRLAGGRGRCQRARPAIVRDPVGDSGLRAHARALGHAAAQGRGRAGAGARPPRTAAGLVHDGQSVQSGGRPAPLSRKRARLSTERAAAGAALPGQSGVLPARQAAGDAGSARVRRAARFLRGRRRGEHRRRHRGDGRVP